jgi:hypothetical protein
MKYFFLPCIFFLEVACSNSGVMEPVKTETKTCDDLKVQTLALSGSSTKTFITKLAGLIQMSSCSAGQAAMSLDQELIIMCESVCTVQER